MNCPELACLKLRNSADELNHPHKYQMYAGILDTLHVPDVLYLAISDMTYRRFFQQKVYEMLVEKFQIRLVVIDIENEEVVSWLS